MSVLRHVKSAYQKWCPLSQKILNALHTLTISLTTVDRHVIVLIHQKNKFKSGFMRTEISTAYYRHFALFFNIFRALIHRDGNNRVG